MTSQRGQDQGARISRREAHWPYAAAATRWSATQRLDYLRSHQPTNGH